MLSNPVEQTSIGTRVHSVEDISVIAGVHGALPPHRYTQDEVAQALIDLPGNERYEAAIRRMLASSNANRRHVVLAIEEYRALLADFGKANAVFIEKAVEL